jgi:hypothetical protein
MFSVNEFFWIILAAKRLVLFYFGGIFLETVLTTADAPLPISSLT